MGSQQVSVGRVNDQVRSNAPAAAWFPLPELLRTAAGAVSRTPASRMGQQIMTKIKKSKPTQKDVKNEGTSGDVYENKWTLKMKNGTSGDVDENTLVSR
jgi:hypothetical protein